MSSSNGSAVLRLAAALCLDEVAFSRRFALKKGSAAACRSDLCTIAMRLVKQHAVLDAYP